MDHHFWDMDHTLIGCDCEVSWKRFLVASGLADPRDLDRADAFFADYVAGTLDAQAYLAFQLEDFHGMSREIMDARAEAHFQARVRPCAYPEARRRVREQVERGDFVALLTATNRTLAVPVARHFGIPCALATEFEVREGRYTGCLDGGYCLGPGKLARLEAFCLEQGLALADVHYYGDSLPDVHVLERVGYPVAVNPVPGLRALAQERGWPIWDFSNELVS